MFQNFQKLNRGVSIQIAFLTIIAIVIIGFASYGAYRYFAPETSELPVVEETVAPSELPVGEEEIKAPVIEQKQILYLKNGDIWATDINVDNPHKFLNLDESIFGFYISPSNQYIAMVDASNRLWITTAKGENLHEIKEYKEGKEPNEPASYGLTQWLADDRFILHSYGQYYIFNINGEFQLISNIPSDAHGYSVTFSPNGDKIAYISGKPGVRKELWVVDIDGRNKQILYDKGAVSKISWSPDSQKILFTVDFAPRYEVWITNLKGEFYQLMKTSTDDYERGLSWVPGKDSIAARMSDSLVLVNLDGSISQEFKLDIKGEGEDFGYDTLSLDSDLQQAALLVPYFDKAKPSESGFSYEENAWRIYIINLGTGKQSLLIDNLVSTRANWIAWLEIK